MTGNAREIESNKNYFCVRGKCWLDIIDKQYNCVDANGDFFQKNCGCGNLHLKYPTPKEFFNEYGFEYPESGAVYVLENNGDEDCWNILDWGEIQEASGRNIDKEIVICACTPFGAPPVDYRPKKYISRLQKYKEAKNAKKTV